MDVRNLEHLISEARDMALMLLDDDRSALSGACLYHAVAVRHFFGGTVEAGSYSWRFTRFDNGSNPTHFSCMFDHISKLHAAHMLQQPEIPPSLILPEMHIWNIIDGKILDISTKHLPEFAMKTGGFRFEKSLMPPLYHFGPALDQARGNWLYQPDPLATKLANKAVEKIEKDNPWMRQE